MSKPIQLIINDVLVPTITRDRYRSYPSKLRMQIDMISGRRTEEERGDVQIIEYSYDKMDDATYRAVMAALRSSGTKTVSYLPDNGDELRTSQFLVQSITQPSLSFYIGGVPKWHNFGFVLREVKPHA